MAIIRIKKDNTAEDMKKKELLYADGESIN
jgi:hypothetical protein